MFIDKSSISWHLIHPGSVSVVDMGSSCWEESQWEVRSKKLFNEKSRSKNLQSKQILRSHMFLSNSFFDYVFFLMWTCRSKILLDNFLPMVQYLWLEYVLYPWLYSLWNIYISVSIPVNKQGARFKNQNKLSLTLDLILFLCQYYFYDKGFRWEVRSKNFSAKSQDRKICNRNKLCTENLFY